MTSPSAQPSAAPSVAPPSRRTWDVVLTIVLLVVALLGGVLAFFLQLFVTAFTDECPPKTCHLDAAVASVFVTWLVVLLVFVVCVVFGIMRLVRHRIAWWLGLIAIFAIIAGSVVGFALYSINVGYT